MKDYEEYQDRACCRALTADCLSCTEGISVEEYCLRMPDTAGCPGNNVFSSCVLYFEYTILIFINCVIFPFCKK